MIAAEMLSGLEWGLGEVLSDDSYTVLRSVLPTGGPSMVLHQTKIPCLLPALLLHQFSLSFPFGLVCLSLVSLSSYPLLPPHTPLLVICVTVFRLIGSTSWA